MKLPLQVVSGDASGIADGKFHFNAKTYFPVANDCNDSVKDSVNSLLPTDFTHPLD
jgi:hypothetical protein